MEKISFIMKSLRENHLVKLGDKKIIAIKDALIDENFDLILNKKSKLNLSPSDVLHYTLEDGTWFCIRPSGTEPKLKIYFGVKANSKQESENLLLEREKELTTLIENL